MQPVRTKRTIDYASDAPAVAATTAAPHESKPLRWGPPPLEAIPDADVRDMPTFGEAPAEELRAEAEMDVEPAAQRSSLSMVPRSLKHPTRPATGE
tara:strand:- start:1145 stop:1432 length:288 start_codon:yes stop_codon:yes gene_type:complete